MQSNLVKTEIIEGEVINNDNTLKNLQPLYITASIVVEQANTDNYIPMLVNHLNQINEKIMQLSLEVKDLKHLNTSFDLSAVFSKLDVIVNAFESIPEWIPAHSLQKSTGLTAGAIRQQLKNPLRFEPGKDFRKNGRIWEVHKNAMSKIRRLK